VKKYKRLITWGKCIGKSAPRNKKFVRDCIQKSIYVQWAKVRTRSFTKIENYTIADRHGERSEGG